MQFPYSGKTLLAEVLSSLWWLRQPFWFMRHPLKCSAGHDGWENMPHNSQVYYSKDSDMPWITKLPTNLKALKSLAEVQVESGYHHVKETLRLCLYCKVKEGLSYPQWHQSDISVCKVSSDHRGFWVCQSLEGVTGFKEEQVRFSSYTMIVRSWREGGSWQ